MARYAWGDDYHGVLKSRLRRFVDGLQERIGRPVKARVFVDDGPMNDRAAAERAGVGWFGKNTNILTSSHGSWVVLGQVVTDLDLKPDAPLKKTCGECVRCIDDCPTGAIVAPYVVDNTRCISFLTIELRGPIPRELRPLVGDWVFGCDICQDVCPAPAHAVAGAERRGVQPEVSQQPDQTGQAVRPPEERLRGAWQHRRPGRGPRPGEGLDRPGRLGARACGVGPGPYRRSRRRLSVNTLAPGIRPCQCTGLSAQVSPESAFEVPRRYRSADGIAETQAMSLWVPWYVQ